MLIFYYDKIQYGHFLFYNPFLFSLCYISEDEFYIADILGADVVSDEGSELGKLIDVMQTGANDVYVVKLKNGKEGLFPAIPDCIKDVDVENKRLTVHVMPGLLD